MKNKKGEMLHETVIFVILNIIFFVVMMLFINLQSSSIHLMEEEHAKQIALLIDSSRPDTNINVFMGEFFARAEKNKINRVNSVIIDNEKNLVIVKGSEDSSFEYGFFNDVNIKFDFKGDYLILEIV